MKIQEAIMSRKPFRRRGWDDDGVWCTVERLDDIVPMIEGTKNCAIELNIPDILADDWILKPGKTI